MSTPPDDRGALRVAPGATVRLSDLPTALPGSDEDGARAEVGRLGEALRLAHQKTIAHESRGLLVVFQGMDGAGKDEAIRDVLDAADPRGVRSTQIKKPEGPEQQRPFLARANAQAPARGEIAVFNRSHYEHVVGARVHPETLDDEGLSDEARRDVWDKRFRAIRDFERYLTDNGIAVLKFMMHVSRDVQRERLLARIDDPDRQWEFSQSDVAERQHWDAYMDAYSEALSETSTAWAPWLVVPADRPWAARVAVARHVTGVLESFHDGFPEADDPEALRQARETLLGEA